MTSIQTEKKRGAGRAGPGARVRRPKRQNQGKAKGGTKMVPSGYAPPIRGVSGSGFRVAQTWAMAGQEDVELLKMRYETVTAYTGTSGAATYLQIKGNSIYRPYPGNTDSPAGYARLFTQYQQCIVMGSRLEVRFWSDVSGDQEPFRGIALPTTPAQYTIYSAYSNVAALRGVPHSQEVLYSPGARMPILRSSGTNAQVLNGSQFETASEATAGTAQFSMGTGADPSSIWYHLVGLQNVAGTTSLNVQAQVMIEFDVMFYRPIATAVQALNRFGNEEVLPATEQKSLPPAGRLTAGAGLPSSDPPLSLTSLARGAGVSAAGPGFAGGVRDKPAAETEGKWVFVEAKASETRKA